MILTDQQVLARSALGYFYPDRDQATVFIRRLASQPTNCLVETAVHQGVSGLIYRNLCNLGVLDMIPAPKRHYLRRVYLATAARNISRQNDLVEILALTNKHDIPIVLLKGASLLHSVYKDPGLRPMEDIDLWIMPEQSCRLYRILQRLGYEKDPLYPEKFRKSQTVLDIRTHLLDADRIRSRKRLLGMDQRNIFNDSVPLKIDKVRAHQLNGADQVLFLGIHALKHDISRLIWLVDMLGVTSSWEESCWLELDQRAAKWGQHRTLAYNRYLIHRIFGIAFKGRHQTKNDSFNVLERFALKRRINKKALPPWSPLVLFATKKGLSSRFHYILETLFPRPAILRQTFYQHARSSPLTLYLLRAAQLLVWPFRQSHSACPRKDRFGS